jgi:uncharacterized protein
MIIDIRKIKRSGLDSQEIAYELEPKANLLDIPEAKVTGPIKVNGEAILSGDHSVLIDVTVEFEIQGPCVRCLENTSEKVEFDIRDDLSGDGETDYKVINDTVDLDKIIYNAVIMNAPTLLLCKEECLGLCPECGENLNYGKCKCKK